MGPLRSLLLLCCVCLEISWAVPTFHEYLDERLRQSKVEIAKFYAEETAPVEIKSYKVEREKLWDQGLSSERPFLLNTNGRMFILEGNRVTPVSDGVPLANETSALQEAGPTTANNTVKFVRSIGWRDSVYLLVCQEGGVCKLYTGGDNLQLRHRQTMRHRGYPTDANFFVFADQLYLVVADNLRQFSTPSIIYRWRGTYMDVLAEVKTVAAVSVSTFNYKDSVIIVFAQNDQALPEIGSAVCELKHSGIDLIQFLPTVSPISIHHYSHGDFDFLLFVSEFQPSNLYWWDGQELLNWLQLPQVNASSIVRIVNSNGETFLLLAHNSNVELYKVQSTTVFTLLHSVKLNDDEEVFDVTAEMLGTEMIVALIISSHEKGFIVESWRLSIEEVPQETTVEDEIPSRCLSELIEILAERMLVLEKAQSSWPLLFNPTENLTVTEPIALPDLVIESGTINRLDLAETPDKTLDSLRERVSNLSRTVDEGPSIFIGGNVTADIVVEGDATIHELVVDSIEIESLNDLRLSDTVLDRKYGNSAASADSESLSVPLDLQVDSLCGVPAEYWARKNDTTNLLISLETAEFLNDTVLLHADVSVPALNVTTLNGVNVQDFFDSLFLLDRDRLINGNVTCKNGLKVSRLTTEELNGRPANDYLTKETDQELSNEFYIESLEVDRLYADSINGVPVSEAARTTKENTIKGKVSIADLHVTGVFASSGIEFPKTETAQVYENVTIRGNVRAKRIDLGDETKTFVNGKRIDFDELARLFWTKSSDQTIEDRTTLEGELTIDRLDAEYLNGFAESEFLYTNQEEISDKFGNLRFLNFHVEGSLEVDGKISEAFHVAPESLTIRDPLHLSHLRANDLLVNVFDGLSVDRILNENKTEVRFDRILPLVEADQVTVQRLNIELLNNQSGSIVIKNMMEERDCLELEYARTDELHVTNLFVDNINGLEADRLNVLAEGLIGLKDLVIDGSLTLEDDLMVARIGNESTETYLERMAVEDIRITVREKLANLTVQNASLNLLQGWRADSLFESFLSKSRDQYVAGTFTFDTITTENANTSFVNDGTVGDLIRIDRGSLAINGNVTFTELFVDGNVIAETWTGNELSKIQNESLSGVRNIKSLTVDGNIAWTSSSSDSSSFSFLIENSVTKDTEQPITGETIFENDVTVSAIKGTSNEFDEVQATMSDSIVRGEEVQEIDGQKSFKETLKVKSLVVFEETNVALINDVNILDFNESVVRNDRDDVVGGSVTFLDEITIGTLLVNDQVHGGPLDGLVQSTDLLPDNVVFDHLIVLYNVSLENLDGVQLDKFVRERITLDGEHEILFETRFNGPIEVTDNATINYINGVSPTDYVLSGTNETQFISGEKTFEDDVIVEGNVYAPLVNKVPMLDRYKEGVQNDDDVDIFGDIVFEGRARVHGDLTASGLTNGLDSETLREIAIPDDELTFRGLVRNETEVEERINRASQIASTLRNVFLYVDTEERLKVEAPNVRKARAVYFEETVKLNLHAVGESGLCGLPKNCSCPVQYIAELTEGECDLWRTNGTRIWNFHEFHGTFGVNVMTNTVTTDPYCSTNSVEEEFTTVSWMKLQTLNGPDTARLAGVIKNFDVRITGYLRDAQVFMHNDHGFVVLARSYEPSRESHSADTLVYKLNFEANELTLHQNISTRGARALKVFKMDHQHGVHLVIGCFDNSSESYLYRFNTVTTKFILLRTFASRSRHVQSLTQEDDHFVLADDPGMNSVNIYRYSPRFDNFYDYQTLFFESAVTGVETFYADDFGHSDSFAIVTTEDGQFHIYEYMFAQKFRMKSRHAIDGLNAILPFQYSTGRYIFAGTNGNSTVLRIVEQGRRHQQTPQ